MLKSRLGRSVWESFVSRFAGSRRLTRQSRRSLRPRSDAAVELEKLEQRLVLAAVGVTYSAGTLTLVSTSGNTNEVVSVKAGSAFTDVLVGGKLTTRVIGATSLNIDTISFNGRGGTADSLNVSGINNVGIFNVDLTDVEKLQLSTTAATTDVDSSTAAGSTLTLVTSTVAGALDITHDGAVAQSGRLLVSGLTTIAAGAGTKNITLSTAGNSLWTIRHALRMS